METFVVRVWLPDRPGALGQVASRIGAVQGDVIGIEILERGGGSAIDELTVTLPDAAVVDLLIEEIRQVDGVAVEDVRRVAADRPDHAFAALAVAEDLVAALPAERLAVLCTSVRELMDGDWSAAMRVDDGHLVAASGEPPDAAWLNAFLVGSSHLGAGAVEATPGDIVWTPLTGTGIAIACGRAGRVFHDRERQQVHALGRIAAALAAVPSAHH